MRMCRAANGTKNELSKLSVFVFLVWRRTSPMNLCWTLVSSRSRTQHPSNRAGLCVLGRLAFIDDLNVVTVRIKHPGRIIARIVFGPSLR